MPYSFLDREKTTVSFDVNFSIAELKKIRATNSVTHIQFGNPISKEQVTELAKHIFSERPGIRLRVFGHRGQDLSFLEKLPMLRKFSADCLINLQNVEYVTTLDQLEELNIGGYNLDSFDFLNNVSNKLTHLSIERTFSKKPTIKFISRFNLLESLYIEGHAKGIEEIRMLKNLKDLTLRSVTTENLDFLKGLDRLWSVDIKLGGIKNFDALKYLPVLKYLELWQINKLADLSFISELKELQNLFLQSLPNVETLPSFRRNSKLRRIYLENMKGLKDLRSLQNAPALEEFVYVLAQSQQPENLIPALNNKAVKKILVRFGSTRKNVKFDEMVEANGKELYSYSDFKYE